MSGNPAAARVVYRVLFAGFLMDSIASLIVYAVADVWVGGALAVLALGLAVYTNLSWSTGRRAGPGGLAGRLATNRLLEWMVTVVACAPAILVLLLLVFVRGQG